MLVHYRFDGAIGTICQVLDKWLVFWKGRSLNFFREIGVESRDPRQHSFRRNELALSQIGAIKFWNNDSILSFACVVIDILNIDRWLISFFSIWVQTST